MHLKTLVIKNFRALEDIHADFDRLVNVIVGPNAIGKTTVLEAIRLAKALLAPRTQNETIQTLFSLKAAVPSNPQELITDAIARDPTKPVEVRCDYELTSEEQSAIQQAMPQLTTNFVLARMGQGFANPAMQTALLSSPEGQRVIKETMMQLQDALVQPDRRSRFSLDFIMDPTSNRIEVRDQIGPAFIGFLDRRNRPNQTVFSYFPADRALPSIDQPVQIGAHDVNAQIESHNSQPQTKYQRLKSTIFNSTIAGATERTELEREFRAIFNGVLKGRELEGVGVNSRGLLSIRVKDIQAQKTFDLDAMSSGEKNLILTLLLISLSIVQDGLILFDEPELHLNPGVCKDLIPFLVQKYVAPKNIQVIMCTHSPDILSGAFESECCSVYHLVSEKNLSPVRLGDRAVIADALRRLGTSEAEGLLYNAMVFVEGEEDAEVLEAGFGDRLRRYRVKDLHGRQEVEKQIRSLQAAEQTGEILTPSYFIFDRDDKPTNLQSSTFVKILQWQRRCLENHLLDMNVLADLLMDSEVVKHPVSNVGDVLNLLREFAMSQLDELAARLVYAEYDYENPGIRTEEVCDKNLEGIAATLFERLAKVRAQVVNLVPSWKNEFVQTATSRRRALERQWETTWREDCDGKRLFFDLHRSRPFRISLKSFKKRVISEMRRQSTADWLEMSNALADLLG